MEYKYKINNVKILANSDVFEEQCFKASFEVNICDKEKADEFVKIFGKFGNLWIRLPTGQKSKKKTGLHWQQFCRLKKSERLAII